MPILKNPGPLLVDKVRGYFDRLPPWLRDMGTFRVEKQKVDAKITDLDQTALESELKQEVTDEKLRTNRYLGDGEAGSGNDMSQFPASHPSEVVITQTGQVGHVTETVGATETHLVEGPPLQDGTSEQVGDLWVTKKVEAVTFDRKSFQKTVDDLLPAEFRASIPQDTTVHTVDGVAATPTLGVNDQVRKEEQVKVGVKETTVQSRDLSGAKPTLIGQRLDPDFNGATLNLAKDVVPDTTVISQPFGMTDAKITPFDDKNAVRETWTTAAGFPVISLINYDSQLNSQVVTQVEVAQSTSFPSVPALTLDWEERKIDAKHKLRITNYVTQLPATISTRSTQTITFPAILSYMQFTLVQLAAANRSEPQWVAGIRSSFSTPTPVVTTTEFFATQPAPISLYLWKPADIIFKGASYSVNFSNLLYDSWQYLGVAYSSDALYGNIQDRFSITATVPSATNYVNAIGSTVAISCVIEMYKRIWVRKTSYITLQ